MRPVTSDSALPSTRGLTVVLYEYFPSDLEHADISVHADFVRDRVSLLAGFDSKASFPQPSFARVVRGPQSPRSRARFTRLLFDFSDRSIKQAVYQRLRQRKVKVEPAQATDKRRGQNSPSASSSSPRSVSPLALPASAPDSHAHHGPHPHCCTCLLLQEQRRTNSLLERLVALQEVTARALFCSAASPEPQSVTDDKNAVDEYDADSHNTEPDADPPADTQPSAPSTPSLRERPPSTSAVPRPRATAQQKPFSPASSTANRFQSLASSSTSASKTPASSSSTDRDKPVPQLPAPRRLPRRLSPCRLNLHVVDNLLLLRMAAHDITADFSWRFLLLSPDNSPFLFSRLQTTAFPALFILRCPLSNVLSPYLGRQT
jgi:hypothetical protein